MKYNVKETEPLQCHITLMPEDEIERKLLKILDQKDREAKEYTFEVHYQQAIRSKFGPKAHLDSIVEHNYPTTVYARYIREGGTLGNR